MAYKTIIVHCADERRMAGVLAPAVALARRCQAHLAGICVLPPVIVDPALTPGGVVTIIDAHRKAYETERTRLRSQFDSAVAGTGLSTEWISADAGHDSVWKVVSDYGRSADLIVAASPDANWQFSNLIEAPTEIVLHSGRPLLLVPGALQHVGVGARILVAWNGSRESARAVYDAMSLLETADTVMVAWINPALDNMEQSLPTADIATALARRGIRCEASAIDDPERSTGEALLRYAEQVRADLLVMGCYGHSRLRELVLGGVTRHVLAEMRLPVLLSH